MGIQHKLLKFPVQESVWEEYHIDQEINDRGVRLDMELVQQAIAMDARSREELTAAIKDMTKLENPNSVLQMKQWLSANGVETDSLDKKAVAELLKNAPDKLASAVEPLHYISQNPLKYVRFPKIERKPRERIILTLEDWHTIIERFKGTRFYIPLMVGFYTGLRISKAFALTWDDIDLEKRTLTVNKQVVVCFLKLGWQNGGK